MDKEELYNIQKKVQDFFDKDTVTIIGSGLSCAEGLPSMRELSESLIANVPKILESKYLKYWNKIKLCLESDTDLESVLQREDIISIIKHVPSIEEAIVKVTYNLISNKDEDVFRKLLNKSIVLRLNTYLNGFATDEYNFTIITTNYDLLVEYACEFSNIPYIDGFRGNLVAEFSFNE